MKILMGKFIDIDHITKRFGATCALDQVCFSIDKGSVHALVGENGAGKSTLMKILVGIHQPDSGRIILDGKPVVIGNPEKARSLGFGIVFQEVVLCPNLSIMENLFLGAEPGRKGFLSWSEMELRSKEVLKKVGLDISPRTLAQELSVAQKQMLQIARAILYKPRLLIFDEPTSSLTQDSVDELFRLIRELHQEGVTILYISHKLPEIFELADTVTVLRDGKHICTMGISELNEDRLVQMMVGRELDLSIRRQEVHPGEVLLKVENLYAGRLEGVSFEVHEGEILGIAGLVGSGRSDLVECIFGIQKIDKGKIWLSGKEITHMSIAERASAGMALVPEDRQLEGLVFTMTMAQNLSLPSVAMGLNNVGKKLIFRSKENSLAEKAITDLKITASGIDAEIQSLSGGNQQKVMIGKWFLVNPRVFILDEPTRGIDVGAKSEIHRLIRKMADDGKAIVVVSSELPELLALSERVLVMRSGRLIGEVCGGKLCEEEIIRLAVGSSG